MVKKSGSIAVIVAAAVALLAVGGVFGDARSANAAPPDDGVYDIAIVEVGNHTDYQAGAGEFDALSSAPGIVDFDIDFVSPGSLTPGKLAGYDVVILPWEHDYAWLDAATTDALVEFVRNGGTLIVHSINIGDIDDPLLAAFGSDYEVTYNDSSGDTVTIIDASNPLLNTPNPLEESDLVGWGSSYHSAVESSGSAWNWATESPDGLIWACAPFGEGAIVVGGQDPEDHDSTPSTFPFTENEIVINDGGLCAGESAKEAREVPARPRRNVSGGVANLPLLAQQARENRERAAAAVSIAPPSTGTGVTISPPSTGTGGLVGSQAGLVPSELLLVLAVGSAGIGLGAARLARRRR